MPDTEEEWYDAWRVKHKFMKDVLKVVEEYIEEAEHQDGASYWISYEDDDFLPDFARYIQNKYPEEFPDKSTMPQDKGGR